MKSISPCHKLPCLIPPPILHDLFRIPLKLGRGRSVYPSTQSIVVAGNIENLSEPCWRGVIRDRFRAGRRRIGDNRRPKNQKNRHGSPGVDTGRVIHLALAIEKSTWISDRGKNFACPETWSCFVDTSPLGSIEPCHSGNACLWDKSPLLVPASNSIMTESQVGSQSGVID